MMATDSGALRQRQPGAGLLVAVLIVVAALAYLSTTVTRGWIPHDEGLLGQSAARVVAGERPHVDFATPYTGGLAHLHAWAFALFEARSSTLRWILFGATSLFVVALLGIFRRQAVGWTPAALLIVLAIIAAPFNYFAPLPSWYNLFCATFGLLCLLAATRAGRVSLRWLFLAGLAAGVSTLFKITGLYFLGAAALAVAGVYVARSTAEAVGRRAQIGSLSVIGIAILAPLGALSVLGMPSATQFIGLLLPVVGLCIALLTWLVRERRSGRYVDGPELLCAWSVLAGGAAVPLLVFCWPYLVAGQLTTLMDGLFVLPRLRYEAAAYPFPDATRLLRGLPALLLLLPAVQRRLGRAGWVLAAGLVVCAVGGPPLGTYHWFWDWLQFAPALLVGVGTLQLLRSAELDSRSFCVFTVLAMVLLIQVPYARPIYFLYAAPLALPAAIEVYRDHRAGKVVQVGIALSIAIHSMLWLNRAEPRWIGTQFAPRNATYRLLPERVNLWVPTRYRGYERVVELIEEHGGDSHWILAGPDAPEIYYLSGRRNPTPTFYEFFDRHPLTEDDVLDLVERYGIRVVVVNRAPEFSSQWSEDVLRAVDEGFPHREPVGPMLVLWR